MYIFTFISCFYIFCFFITSFYSSYQNTYLSFHWIPPRLMPAGIYLMSISHTQTPLFVAFHHRIDNN